MLNVILLKSMNILKYINVIDGISLNVILSMSIDVKWNIESINVEERCNIVKCNVTEERWC